jgi:hypothetical protein
MNLRGPVLALALLAVGGGCDLSAGASTGASAGAPSPSVAVRASGSSSTVVLRQSPPDLGCDTIGWEGEPYRTLTFHVDPDAPEQVWAESNTGAPLLTYWSEGFQAGTPDERLVRDPQGGVFISDGDVVEVPAAANLRIHGYLICLQPDKLYVLTNESG